jgi:hypothetical protein
MHIFGMCMYSAGWIDGLLNDNVGYTVIDEMLFPSHNTLTRF